MSLTKENLVRIGNKPTMNYVVACVTLFNSQINEVRLRARGRAICNAVDTVEMLRRSFVKDLLIKSIDIGSEDVDNPDGTKSTVSIIEIVVGKE